MRTGICACLLGLLAALGGPCAGAAMDEAAMDERLQQVAAFWHQRRDAMATIQAELSRRYPDTPGAPGGIALVHRLGESAARLGDRLGAWSEDPSPAGRAATVDALAGYCKTVHEALDPEAGSRVPFAAALLLAPEHVAAAHVLADVFPDLEATRACDPRRPADVVLTAAEKLALFRSLHEQWSGQFHARAGADPALALLQRADSDGAAVSEAFSSYLRAPGEDTQRALLGAIGRLCETADAFERDPGAVAGVENVDDLRWLLGFTIEAGARLRQAGLPADCLRQPFGPW